MRLGERELPSTRHRVEGEGGFFAAGCVYSQVVAQPQDADSGSCVAG